MTRDREADEQARRLAAKVADCRDRPVFAAEEIIGLEDEAQLLRSEIARLKARIAELETRKGAES